MSDQDLPTCLPGHAPSRAEQASARGAAPLGFRRFGPAPVPVKMQPFGRRPTTGHPSCLTPLR